MVELDGFGKPCPQPLVMVKKEIDAGNTDVAIKVDNETAVKNITRLAGKKGLGFQVADIDGGFLITLGGELDPNAEAPKAAAACSVTGGSCGYSVFIGKDHVGEGDGELGYNLMKMALYTLNQAEVAPMNLLFMNSGVKLLCGDEAQIIDSVKEMMEKGTDVLVCGTCLNFYECADDLKVGEVSNMYDILERMHESAKVITL
ncbi:MAG: sulfurtransferase-like selenium metabolism protein YedF [Coriobacteriia bacterium]|nr:sulfurtransferase-like selenium metabolism protein YedF [Coriobacteriia bacterium]